MFPWLWIYAPVTRWPWSGAVRENVSPEVFFGSIKPEADRRQHHVGQPAELAAVRRAIEDLLLDLAVAGPSALSSPAALASLESLQNLAGEIAHIKAENRESRVDAAIALLDRLAAESPDDLRRVLAHYHS